MIKLKYDYLLPIGSIVKVNGIEQKIMIFGYLQKGAAIPEHTFEYVGVPYPEGFHNPKLNIGFDHAAIQEEIFKGYTDDNNERNTFLLILEAAEHVLKKKGEGQPE